MKAKRFSITHAHRNAHSREVDRVIGQTMHAILEGDQLILPGENKDQIVRNLVGKRTFREKALQPMASSSKKMYSGPLEGRFGSSSEDSSDRPLVRSEPLTPATAGTPE